MTAKEPVRWLLEHAENGRVLFRVGRHGDEVVAEWPALASLTASIDGHWSRFVPNPDADPALAAKLQKGASEGLLAHLRGDLALHASCFELGGRAVALLGPSGAGKSTAVADLCLRGGARFIADDVMVLDSQVDCSRVVATEDSHWLTADSRRALHQDGGSNGKQPLLARAIVRDRIPLCALVSLEFDDELGGAALERVRGVEMLARLLPSIIRFIVDDPGVQVRELDQLGRLLEATGSFVLRRPRNMGALEDARRILIALAAIPTASGSDG